MIMLDKLEVGKTYVFRCEQDKERFMAECPSKYVLYKSYYSEGFTIEAVGWFTNSGYVDGEFVISNSEIKYFKLKEEKTAMNKQEAIKLLGSLDLDSVKEAIVVLEAPECVTERTSLVFDSEVDGYLVRLSYGFTEELDLCTKTQVSNGLVYKTREAAELRLKYERLNTKARKFIVEAWGEYGKTVNWCSMDIKYVILLSNNSLDENSCTTLYHKLHFPTLKSRELFREQFSDEDIKLIIKGVE